MRIDTAEVPNLLNRLCHVLVLSKGAETSQIVQRLILTVLSIDEGLTASNAEQLGEAFDAYFGVRLPLNQLSDAIAELVDREYLTRGPSGRLTVADPSRRQVLADIAASQEVERG